MGRIVQTREVSTAVLSEFVASQEKLSQNAGGTGKRIGCSEVSMRAMSRNENRTARLDHVGTKESFP